MARLIHFAFCALLIVPISAAASAPVSASAKAVDLPAGNLNGASGNCPANATSAILKSGQEEFAMAIGDRLSLPARRGDEWKIICIEEGVTMTTGTRCFFDGYVVAGFEREAVAISCYEGEIPNKRI